MAGIIIGKKKKKSDLYKIKTSITNSKPYKIKQIRNLTKRYNKSSMQQAAVFSRGEKPKHAWPHFGMPFLRFFVFEGLGFWTTSLSGHPRAQSTHRIH